MADTTKDKTPEPSVSETKPSETSKRHEGSKLTEKSKKKQPGWILHYNAISAALWFSVLSNTVFFTIKYGQPDFFASTFQFLTAIQCLAIVEIYNSLVGNVRAPLFTTMAQVASRLLVVIGVFTLLPESPVNYTWVYVTLCTAWSITEVIRYSFYAINIETEGNPPDLLVWLRYTTFIPLYPMGISSECFIMYKSLDIAALKYGVWYKFFFIACLLTYIPGSYILFTYMLKQRGKVLSKLGAKTEKKEKKEKED